MYIDWRAALNVIGLSSLIGAVLSWWLTSRREHRRWILDNKKLEWRELITELYSCGQRMARGFHRMRSDEDMQETGKAAHEGLALITNRIFIADSMQKHGVPERWSKLIEYVNAAWGNPDPSQNEPPTSQGFTQRVQALQADLLNIARTDLNL
jgi:hypothetical protein